MATTGAKGKKSKAKTPTMAEPKGKILDLVAIRTARERPRRTYLDAYLESLSDDALRDHFLAFAERLADRVGNEGFPRFPKATLRELLNGWHDAANGDEEANAMLVEAVWRARAVGLTLKEYGLAESGEGCEGAENRH
jgi:hypothetical protein